MDFRGPGAACANEVYRRQLLVVLVVLCVCRDEEVADAAELGACDEDLDVFMEGVHTDLDAC